MNFQEGVKVVGKRGTGYEYGKYIVIDVDHDDEDMTIKCIEHEFDEDEVGELHNYVNMSDFESADGTISVNQATTIPKIPAYSGTQNDLAILMGWIN